MHRSSGPRKTANLSQSLNQQLNMYALAATAAGVGMLSLVQPSEAKIIYTKANIRINSNSALVDIDLNHDGIKDFQFSATYRHTTANSFYSARLKVGPVQKPNRVWAVESFNHLCADALPKGKGIGPGRPFQPAKSNLVMAFISSLPGFNRSSYGPWLGYWDNKKPGYLGLKFVIEGKAHFGWAAVTRVTGQRGLAAVITGYAYETVAGKAIEAGQTKGTLGQLDEENPGPGAFFASPTLSLPQPGTLGVLATGAPGLPTWRRKESIGANQ